ncbi:MAG: DUF2804 domain-containing protein [Lachnospiraceae bacterium]|nr:DUF2804 domain-containing protein [Lachnospiraceae bacterium]
MRNHEVITKQPLLNEFGEINEPGWARKQIWNYKKDQIKAPKFRLKEWDYYMVIHDGKGVEDSFAVAFTISDDGYVGLQSVSFLLLNDDEPWEHTETVLNLFPMGKLELPESSNSGNTKYDDNRLKMVFYKDDHSREIKCLFKNFYKDMDLIASIYLEQPPMDTMVIATPWDKKHAFYYNQKINTMTAKGRVLFDGKTYKFDGVNDYGTLDWGRGVWTYDNTWYWGSGNGKIDGHDFGFNIGYGFGNTKAATENIIFYDGVAHKLDDVKIEIPNDVDLYDMKSPHYMEPWNISESGGRFEMKFRPLLDRAANMNFKVIVSDQHQVFGRMSGVAILDDKTKIEIKDMLCFIEKVHNKY